MATHNGTVHVLDIERGQKYDEQTGEGAIASLDRSIVFVPKGAKVGQRARLKLAALKDAAGAERTDRNGVPMYRSVPAPVEYENRWRQESDGTLSQVTYAINWLLEESEAGVCENRPAATREVELRTELEKVIVWGVDLADSILQLTTQKVVGLEIEQVWDGQLVWVKTSERKDSESPRIFGIAGCESVGGSWTSQRLQLTVGADMSVDLSVGYQEVGETKSETVRQTWSQLPQWLQSQLLAVYPVCQCGRARRETQADGYDRCELCRAEAECGRCGREPQDKSLGIKVVDGRNLCTACQSAVEMEKSIEVAVPATNRAQVAVMAKRLLAGRHFERKVGEMVVEQALSHISDQSTRSRFLAAKSGYGWYYATEDGIWGTKFSPEALEILSLYPRATGDGLITMTAWLTGGYHKADDCERNGDYFHRSQVKHEDVLRPFSAGQSSYPITPLAVRLCGNLGDREKALALRDEAFDPTLESDLQSEGQDYSKMVTTCIERRTARKPIAVEYNCGNADGDGSVTAGLFAAKLQTALGGKRR